MLHELGFHYNVALVGRYSKQGSAVGKSGRQLIFPALRDAIDKHPALAVTVAASDTPAPYFERIEKVDLREVTSFEKLSSDESKETDQLDQLLSDQHSRGFKMDGRPLWRVVVLEKLHVEHELIVDIAFIWHHVIGDGRSGLGVLSTILQSLNSLLCRGNDKAESSHSEGGDSSVFANSGDPIVMTNPNPMFPALEEILSLPMSTPPNTSNNSEPNSMPLPSKPSNTSKWSGAPYHCEEPIKTRIRHITIPHTSVETLVLRCRKERTSITTFLQSLAGRVLVETFPTADRLRCAVAISVRRFFPPQLQIDDSVMGLWVSAFHLEYTRAQLATETRNNENEHNSNNCSESHSAFPWDHARQNSQRIAHEIAKGETDVGIAKLRYIPDFRSALLRSMGKEREDSFAITNLGLFPRVAATVVNNEKNNDDDDEVVDPSSTFAGPPPGPGPAWHISNLVFSQSCHVNGSAAQFCIVSVRGGDMCVALSWQEGTVADEDATQILEKMQKALLELGGGSES